MRNDLSILFIRNPENPVQPIEDALAAETASSIEWVRADSLFDGLRILQERDFDLIISDLFLPDGQGLATVRHLTQHTSQAPLILLCHSNDREIAVNAVRTGAHDFFCYEEFEPASLRRSVQAVLTAADGAEAPPPDPADRRNNARFPCRLAVSYRALEHPFLAGEAISETLNISSKGLLFSTTEPLEAGQLFQVSVDWPARLENHVPLKLVAEGRVIRNTDGLVAMSINKYEFRTRRVKTDEETQRSKT